jgi:hypothetical protein
MLVSHDRWKEWIFFEAEWEIRNFLSTRQYPLCLYVPQTPDVPPTSFRGLFVVPNSLVS